MIRWAKLLEGEDPFSTRDLVTWPQAGLRASTLLMLVGFRFIVSGNDFVPLVIKTESWAWT